MLAKFIISALLSLSILTSFDAHSKALLDSTVTDNLVTAEWLHQHLDASDLVVLDTTVQIDFDENGQLSITSGRAQFSKGHIPTARFADLTGELVDTTSEYPYAIPEPEYFAAAMEALGVGDDSLVVLYASDYSAWAARVWWMLRWIGFDNAVILNGGLNAWTSAGFQLTTEPAQIKQTTLSVSVRPELIAYRDEVYDAISDNDVLLIDSMPAEHYRGEMAMYGRPGHIPTAINVPNVWAEDGRFLSDEALDKLHPVDRDKRVITYCGGGISASASAFAMHRLGFSDIAVYMNSLDEWADNPENPLNVVTK